MEAAVKPFTIIITIGISVITLINSSVPACASDASIEREAASRICEICGTKNRSRLAIYPFTDATDKETEATKKTATRLISLVLQCGRIKIVDPSKVAAILEEQEKGMTGAVDDQTAPKAGKLLGADALLFGQAAAGSLQIRIVDATTGEILGATVTERGASGKPAVQIEQFDKEVARLDFRRQQLRKHLAFLFHRRPLIYLFMTATDDELSQLEKNNPRLYRSVRERLDGSSDDQKKKFDASRSMVLELRRTDASQNRRIIESHQDIRRRLQERRPRNR